MLLEHTILCKSLKAPIICLCFASKEPDFLVGFRTVISSSPSGFLKIFQFYSLDFDCFLTHFQFLDLTMLFKKINK